MEDRLRDLDCEVQEHLFKKKVLHKEWPIQEYYDMNHLFPEVYNIGIHKDGRPFCRKRPHDLTDAVYSHHEGNLPNKWERKPEYTRILEVVPRYSTDINDAWLIVEELERRELSVDLGMYPIQIETKWMVSISADIRIISCSFGGTAMEALCLATLDYCKKEKSHE